MKCMYPDNYCFDCPNLEECEQLARDERQERLEDKKKVDKNDE